MKDTGPGKNPKYQDQFYKKKLIFNNLINGRKNFHASNGWLHKWKKRHQIRHLTIARERLSADEEASAHFSTGFCKFIRDHHYSRDQIYNADETGLMWKSLPSKTLVANYEKKAPGRKVLKDRVTIMICSNASGTHKISLLVIGKVKKPRCFKNMKVLPVVYKAQRSGWMDRIIFKEWYTDVFIPEIIKKHGQNARCVLLLDNALSHPPAEELNLISDLCLVTYLPPNVTAISQPMDQGIIEK
ncbi:jerky protein homolog-like, partial [Pseudomyrmex gracilis]|uniref:jerky protein homolog-like n=1 Tax=Pseudomyrmex gracilis TaxID=219809 RepID=UPI000995BC69